MTNGVKTSEFYLSLIATVMGTIMPLLVLYGALTLEQASAWSALVMALAAVLVPLIVSSVAKNYNDGRVKLKAAAMQQQGQANELAILRETRLEKLGQ